MVRCARMSCAWIDGQFPSNRRDPPRAQEPPARRETHHHTRDPRIAHARHTPHRRLLALSCPACFLSFFLFFDRASPGMSPPCTAFDFCFAPT